MIAGLIHAARVVRSLIREKAKDHLRSPRWRHVKDAFLKGHPECAACGGAARLQVHHKQPFHVYPALELDPANLVVLCMGPLECHLLIGHGDDWPAWNPHVEADAATCRASPAARADIIAAAARLRMYGGRP